ncbi:hypothetical protein D3C77_726220 [compost metagenome]
MLQQQLFDLHPGNDVDKIERFVPNMQMSAFAEAFRDQNLLLLTAAKRSDVLFELQARKIEFSQNCFEQAFVKLAGSGEFRQIAPQL